MTPNPFGKYHHSASRRWFLASMVLLCTFALEQPDFWFNPISEDTKANYSSLLHNTYVDELFKSFDWGIELAKQHRGRDC
jgi:hypothetical protein